MSVFFFLSPRRGSGERIEGGGPSSPRPSPPLRGGEGVFGCGSAALRCIHANRLSKFGQTNRHFRGGELTSQVPDDCLLRRYRGGCAGAQTTDPKSTVV